MRQKTQQNSTTFASLASAWAADRRPYVKDSTYLNYTLTIRTRLNPRFGAQRTVEEGEVQQYILSLLGAGLSRKTVRDTVALLKQILRWGAKRGLAAYTEWELQWPTHREPRRVPTLMPALRAARRASRSPYVVTGQTTPSIEPHRLREYFNRLLRRLGIPKIVFHGLRHTFATRCIEAGCDPKTVSSILGHSNVALTLNLYVHPDMEAKRRAALHMERAMRLKPKTQNE